MYLDYSMFKVIFSVIIFFGVASTAAPLEPHVQRLRFRHIGLEHGLPSMVAADVVEDESGVIWICTSKGLCRYDGGRIAVFTLGKDLQSLADSWFTYAAIEGSILGLRTANTTRAFAFNTRTSTFADLPSSHGLWKTVTMRMNKFRSGWRVEVNRNLVEPSGVKHPLPEKSGDVHSVDFIDSNEVWISAERGLFVFHRETKRFEVYHHDAEDPSSIGFGAIEHVYKDSKGVIWVCTYGGGVSITSRNPSEITTIRTLSLSGRTPGGLVFGLSEHDDGSIWSATGENGLQKYDVRSGRTEVIHRGSKPLAIPGDELRSLVLEKDGRIWSGSKKLFCLDRRNRTCSVYPVPADEIVVKTSDDVIWCKSIGDSLLRVFDPKRKMVTDSFPADARDESKLSTDRIRFVFEDKRKRVWIGTSNGLHLYHPTSKSFTRYLYTKAADIDRAVSYHGPYYTQTIVEDDRDRLWIGTRGGGLVCFDTKTMMPKYFGMESGVDDLFVYVVIRDSDGDLWLGTSTGLLCFSLSSNSVIKRITTEDGLLSNEFNTWSATRLHDGRLAMGGLAGYHVFDPSVLKKERVPGPVLLSRVRLNGSPYASDSSDWLIREVDVQYGDKLIEVEYSTPEFLQPEKLRYEYLLSGSSAQWVTALADHRIVITSLQYGEYELLIRSSFNGTLWNAPFRLKIHAHPPFWLRWWFLLGIVLVTAAIVVSVTRRYSYLKHRSRILGLENEAALMKQREQISLDMHDEVGSSITKILTISRLPLNADEGIAKERMQRIADLAVSMVDSIQQIVWALNPANDALDATVATLRAYAKETLDDARVALTFVGDDDVDGRILPLASRRNIYLFVKEAINNVVRHSSATSCTLEVRVHGDELIIRIADNGRGLGSAHAGGNGVMSMRRRIESIGGTLVLDSPHGSGTTVSARIPFTEQ